MDNNIVTTTRCLDYSPGKISEALKRHFELSGGLARFIKPSDHVLLKPNFIAPRSQRHATQTNPTVIIETARLLKDFGAKPFVADSPAWTNTFVCAKKLKLLEPLKKLGVPLKQLDSPKKCLIGQNRTKVGISSLALDADAIINIPKFKTHQQLTATFAVKNMFGCVTGKKKAYWHFAKGGNYRDFCELIIEIYRYLKPAITIIDGVMAMDAQGPICGRTRPLGWLIAGTNPFQCEIVCARLIRMAPDELPIIKTARRMGLLNAELEAPEILGDSPSSAICTDFQLPKLVPIRFSLLHVCKSIAKQFLLLMRSAMNSARPTRNKTTKR